MSIKQINLLELLGIDWDTKIQRWDEHYWLLEDYYKEHGNSDVPKSYCINGVNLGIWLNTQKHGNNSITDQQITALNLLGIKWNIREEKWDQWYSLLEKYYKENGNIDVPLYYEVKGLKLGIWLNSQRQAYNGDKTRLITEDRILLLNDLGMKWDLCEENWNERYKLLKDYYEEHGNSDVSSSYEINDIMLGVWLKTQRRAYKGKGKCKITNEHIKLLNDLDIDWGPKDTKFLNGVVTTDNVDRYTQVLDGRLFHILDDLIYEKASCESQQTQELVCDFVDYESQKQIEEIIIKRLWR